MIILYLLIHFLIFVNPSLQICLEETSYKGLSVRWPQSEEGIDIKSDPLCYNEDTIITRNCVNNTWIPSLAELTPCFEALHIFDTPQSSMCPATYMKVSENNTNYCYKVEKASSWSFPCLQGGASVITHLSDDDVESVLTSLKKINVSRYFWLPGRRATLFSPLIWNTPGKMWGRNVESNNFLPVRDCIFKNCLILDIEAREITSELCWIEYPSLCFYRNVIHYPANCPEYYTGVRFTPQESICAGIKVSHEELSFEEFSNMSHSQCTPMGDNIENDLSRYVYKEIAKNYAFPENTWCWFSTSFYNHVGDQIGIFKSVFSDFRVSINNKGSIKLNRKQDSMKLSCLACRTQILYEQPELFFEYNELHNTMFLTIYYPSGLWKYSENDTGIQCFSDAKGFVKVIDFNELPYMQIKTSKYQDKTNSTIEKVVYKVDLITDRSAQYWCEGHTNNFTLIATEKVIANPQGNDIHVFSLGLEIFFTDHEIRIELNEKMIQVCENVTLIFNADKVLLMEMLTYASEKLLVLLHMHMPIMNIYNDKGDNIKMLYENIKQIAETELFKYNYTFVNISSSMYCLPTTSDSEGMILEWELTAIGHIAAPKQFCLQANGLPVKRRCLGSYILGSRWGQVEGVCNKNYSPSIATTYLYKFYKGRMPANDTFEFLTNGLGYILNDVDIFIPADIYYLSISLQQILNIAQSNESSVDMGTIENIAWIMNRVMILDNRYLRLAQTLNSTNVILDAVDVIIHKLVKARRNTSTLRSHQNVGYDLARQPNFLIQICYPTINNISGIAIRYKTNTSNFFDVDIIPLFKNTTYDEVLLISNLDIATWIPGNVLDSLIISQNLTSNETLQVENIRIIISIFHNGAVFQELDPNDLILNSRVIGVSIPGFLPNLLHPIPLIFRNFNNLAYKKQCGYWDFMVKNRASGFWSSKGCYLVSTVNNTSICNCYHLTHFGQLINIRQRIIDDHAVNTKPLNIISLIGSFLSLLGITGIWLTAFVFQAWRKKAGSKVLLNLTGAIAMPLIIMVVFNLGDTIFLGENGKYFASNKMKIICIFLGAILHYSVLASFMWMLITASLQFIRYVRVLGDKRPSRFMIKFTLIGWGIPLVPVAAVLIFDPHNYIPTASLSRNEYAICYPTGFYLIVTVIVPICIILFINITLFISVLYAISHGPDGKMRTTDIDLIGAQIRLSIFLFFLLGLTWIFGIFSFTKNLVWSYFFCLTSTLQGFVLFVYFVICDPITRNLWVTLMKPQFRSNSPRESVTSITNT
ncbi:uncharacterized protein LOC125054381 [Pieris napi]|uniref:uncharacterized protein LOC125054381 n=1 Tax=Pieris napi TaxID=78633 RepID=UPI001FBB0F1F|nr:uncharacterized protein LOC125054381 [Pieris napi]